MNMLHNFLPIKHQNPSAWDVNFSTPNLESPVKVVDPEMMGAAKEFESVFIAQMLQHSGLTESLTLSGGKSVAAFSDFYVQSFSSKLVEDGGFGLAQKIYDSMASKKQAQSAVPKDIQTENSSDIIIEKKNDIIIGKEIKGKS